MFLFLFLHKLLFLSIIILIPLINSQVYPDLSNTNCKVTYIGSKFFYIINKTNNNYLYSWEDSSFAKNYDISIKNNKDIIKLDDNNFVIYGLDDSNFFNYQIFNILSNVLGNVVRVPNLNFNQIGKLNGKLISEKKLIISSYNYNNFKVYLIDLNNNNNNKEKTIPDNINGVRLNNMDDIHCDSSDGKNYFCIFCIITGTTRVSYYLKGNFENAEISSGKICSNCYNGDVIKLDNLNDKYLLCYENAYTSIFISIYCQYYSFKNNNNILIEESKEVGKLQITSSIEKPLILYKYDYSIIIQFDYISNSKFCMTIICSLDLKLYSQSNFIKSLSETVNIFNDVDFLYAIYEDNSSGSRVTKLKKQKFISCNSPTSLSLSDTELKEFKFFEGHSEDDLISFSLDENINLFKGVNGNLEKEFISPHGNNFIPYENNIIFNFKKKEITGTFQNYYCYISNLEGEFYTDFSLICPIKLIICHDTCETCNSDKIASSSQHFCTKCDNNYYPIESESHNVDGFNCYLENDQNIKNNGYYLDNNNNAFYPCHSSCKTCSNGNSCETCKNGYYFKADKNNIIINDICYTSIMPYYYIDHNVNINHNGEIITAVYKSCYDSCKSCNGEGTYENNNCIECKVGKKYPFDDRQCINNHEDCLKGRQYWEFSNNNIICINDCNNNIIMNGDNKGQCVSNCENYINPNSKTTFFFTLMNCNGKNYCIPFNTCLNGKFNIDYDEHKCYRIGECNIDIFDDDDPFIHDNDIPTSNIDTSTEDIISPDQKRQEINKRIKIFKMFRNEYNYSLWYMFDKFLIQDYIKLLNKELENHIESEIYLITTTKYDNFTITIYPLDIEEYAYEQILAPNNLGFVNFTKTFSNFIEYEIKEKCIILIILLESHLTNSSINDLNYYFYGFKEKNEIGNIRNEIKISEDTYLTNNESYLEVLYPLYNYYDENSNINKRNSEYLVDNIKSMYFKYPDIELYNLSDPFYNDICSIYTSEVNTDMSLNDRRNEYFVNISLCETNCYLVKILNKDLKNP